MYKAIPLLLATYSTALNSDSEIKFLNHVADHSLSYGTIEEFAFRKNLFM